MQTILNNLQNAKRRMSKQIKLKKGFDIKLKGKAELKIAESDKSKTYAVKPSSFHGIERPKLLVDVGDNVKAGTPVFFDKKHENIKHCSPVSGEVVEVRRGEKRKILEIVVLADKENEYESFKKHSVSDINNISSEDAIDNLLNSGIWPSIIQRPFGIIANPQDTPKAIFISAFDSHPLAPDYNFIFKDQDQYFQAGIDVLKKLTSGLIHLNIDADSEVSHLFAHTKNVQLNKFSGPHPSGNVGVQIHHIDPINRGDVAWTLKPQGVVMIGKLFLEGKFDASTMIALTGDKVENPKYFKTYIGASVEGIVAGNLAEGKCRIISGNVLTGEKVEESGHIGYFDHQLTVIEEGDYHAPFGWVLPTVSKPSFSRALGILSFLFPEKEFSVDTNTNGEARAFVQTGVFEKVTPMDILPTYLLKAILADDFDEMEELGIYEIIEEDLALCEFVDVSKHDVQSIVREGLELIQFS